MLIKKAISTLKISVIFSTFNSQNFLFFCLFVFWKFYYQNYGEVYKFITLNFLKAGLLILAFKCDIYGRIISGHGSANDVQKFYFKKIKENLIINKFSPFLKGDFIEN